MIMEMRMKGNGFWLSSALAAVLLIAPVPHRAEAGWLSTDAGEVSDSADIFTEEQEKALTQYHAKLLEAYDIDYRVVSGGNVGDIDAYAYMKFSEDSVGENSKTGRGLLLVIDPRQNLLRLEVSKGLEGVYTDAFVSYVEHRQMIPFFKAGRISDGILATSELIFGRAAEAAAGNDFDQEKMEGSSGGGVSNPAAIGSGMEEKSSVAMASPDAEAPDAVVAAYLTAMEARNSNPDLPIYSAATRAMMQKWVVTPAQMDTVVKSYLKCAHDDTSVSGAFAVVRYRVEDRICSPYFLVFEDGGWKLDLTMMQRAIRFNHNNYWHFDTGSDAALPYMFAFRDWQFDEHGFPHPGRKLRWYLTVGTYRDTGTIVEWVGKDSPAERLGLLQGDRILDWNGVRDPHHSQISAYMDQAPEGAPITILVDRQGQRLTLTGKAPPKP